MSNKIAIDSKALLKEMVDKGYNRQSMGKKIGCTGRCIGAWLQRGVMPEELYKKIRRVLDRQFKTQVNCGCELDGDIFIYKGQEVWLDLHAIYEEGWQDCKHTILNMVNDFT